MEDIINVGHKYGLVEINYNNSTGIKIELKNGEVIYLSMGAKEDTKDNSGGKIRFVRILCPKKHTIKRYKFKIHIKRTSESEKIIEKAE